MDKLKINLIPPEIKEQAKKEAKRSLMVKVSIGLLGLLIILTVSILAVIIFQNAVLQALNKDLEEQKTKIASLDEKEAVVFFLKNRIDGINQFSKNQDEKESIYELIRKLTPVEISLASLQIDKTNIVSFQGNTNSTAALDVLFNNLIDPKTSEGKIASVSVESLSKTQNSNITFNLAINLAGGKSK